MFGRKKVKTPVKLVAPRPEQKFGLPLSWAPTSANPAISGGAGIANSYQKFAAQTAIVGNLAAPRMVDISSIRKK